MSRVLNKKKQREQEEYGDITSITMPGDREPVGSQNAGEGDSIKVVVRVRPPAKSESEMERTMCLDVNQAANAIILHCKPEHRVFTFDRVADVDAAQETIFSSVGKKIIESCVAGYNGTIFAYGQTGSGKTFTMLGPSEDADNFQHELRGIIPRSFEYLFNMINRQKELRGDNVQFLCRCSFLEIYNEQIFDLLDAASMGLQLRENIKKGVFVDGLIENTVASASDAYQVLSSGWMNRTVASTSMNRESSRSHAVFTVTIESKENKNGVWNVRTSQLNLVDLAGSERQRDTHTVGIRLKEGCSINKSLSALGNVIMALVDIAHGKTRHVPYRDSKLSFLLRDSLGGNAKTYMIACVHPGAKCFGETLSTLQFAQRAKMIKNKAIVNENSQGSVTLLQAEIKRLKEALLQYQQGAIPANPSPEGVDGSTEQQSLASGDSQWQRLFLWAMYYREQAENDRKGLEETNHKLLDTCRKKDQALQQTRMIVKFRDEVIKKLERTKKEQTELTADEKDGIIESLRGEVKALGEISQRAPNVTKFLVENEKLQLEIKRLKSECAASSDVETNRQKAAELEQRFRELQAELDKEGEKRPASSTPQQTPEGSIAVATLERHKSQIAKLQSELDTLKREKEEEREASQKALMEKEAALVSTQKGREELQKILKAHHIRVQIEREAVDDRHMETIKMLTPKRAKYQLRNRTIMVPTGEDGESPVTRLDYSGDEDFIMSEAPPQELIEEKVEALTDEIAKLKEENRQLKTQYEERDTEILKAVETHSRLEEERKQLEERIVQDKAQMARQEKELQNRLEQLEKEKVDMENKLTYSQSEAQDTKICLDQMERQYREVRQQRDHIGSQLASLETKLLQIELSEANLQREYDKKLKKKKVPTATLR